METLSQKIQRVLQDKIELVPYDPAWPQQFQQEKAHLLACLPSHLINRIEHFGSTAVPGLAAKPVVDMLVEVTSLAITREQVPPILEAQGYDYFWRPTRGDDGPPFYAWFIKRDVLGHRTHHIHMVEAHFEHWERLLFRDYLIAHPEVAREYEILKYQLATQHSRDRVTYTEAKTTFIQAITARAKQYYQRGDRAINSERATLKTLGDLE
ncbi:MAG: GrpB family protein [Leptolyngbya sp. SIO1D8]|nr:GrpB family protein [Leptolyngbya sp. SIO1D8]